MDRRANRLDERAKPLHELRNVLLLARKKLALPVFIASLIGVLAQNYYNFFASNAVEVMGAGAAAMPVMVIVIAILLICLTVNARTKGWLI